MSVQEKTARGDDLREAAGHGLTATEDHVPAGGGAPPDTTNDLRATGRREIAARRRDLYDAMRRLEESVARASGIAGWGKDVGDALSRLHITLEQHVAETEAADGLLAEVIESAPHLTSQVETLRQEHVRLLESSRSAMDLVSNEGQVAEIRRRVLAILGRLARHRQRGSELVFDAYNVDLAAGD